VDCVDILNIKCWMCLVRW